MFGVATLIHSSIKAAMIRMHSVWNRRRSKKSVAWWDANRSSFPSVTWSPNSRTNRVRSQKYTDAAILAMKMAFHTRGWHTSTGAGFRDMSRPASGVIENTPCIFNSFAGFASEKPTNRGSVLLGQEARFHTNFISSLSIAS